MPCIVMLAYPRTTSPRADACACTIHYAYTMHKCSPNVTSLQPWTQRMRLGAATSISCIGSCWKSPSMKLMFSSTAVLHAPSGAPLSGEALERCRTRCIDAAHASKAGRRMRSMATSLRCGLPQEGRASRGGADERERRRGDHQGGRGGRAEPRWSGVRGSVRPLVVRDEQPDQAMPARHVVHHARVVVGGARLRVEEARHVQVDLVKVGVRVRARAKVGVGVRVRVRFKVQGWGQG